MKRFIVGLLFLLACNTYDVEDLQQESHLGCPHTSRAGACADLSYAAQLMYQFCDLGDPGEAVEIIQQGHSCNDTFSVNLNEDYDIMCTETMENCASVCYLTGVIGPECTTDLVKVTCAPLLVF